MSTSEKLISVVIPSYNHEKYISEAIKSVLGQDYSNFELIIIDDGSQDNSDKIITSFKDSRIKYIKQENSGAHASINRGLEISSGDYLSILNSDDVYTRNRFKEMSKILDTNKSIDFICSYIEIINQNGKKLGIKEGFKNLDPWPMQNPEKTFKKTNDFKKNLLMSNFIATTSNMFFRRNIYDTIGGMRNLRFAHDWDFALRVAEKFECYLLEKPVLKYRIHNNNTISSNKKWMLFEIVWVFVANINKFKNIILDDENEIFTLLDSMNFQCNDKLVWGLKCYIDFLKSNGVVNAEEILLDNKELREKFLEYIIE